MRVVEVTTYEHFVSFLLEEDDGRRVSVDYRGDQVWRNAEGEWSIGDEREPFHVAAQKPAPKIQISATLLLALAQAAAGLF